jgi:hypothetical protein
MLKGILKATLPLLFILIGASAFSQITKFRTTSLSMKSKNERTRQWSKWSQPKDVDVLITIDIDNKRIRIFSKEEQVYDIIKFYDIETDDEGDETLKFHCINEDGLKCFVRFVVLNSRDGQRQLYVDFADMLWMYNIYKLD